jgi:hypothetical protein
MKFTFTCELNVGITFLVQFDMVVEHTNSTDSRWPHASAYTAPTNTSAFTFPTLPFLLFGGPFSLTSQGQLLVALLPHELLRTDGMLLVQPYFH